jgi:cobalamin biosynthesis protein CbiD
VPWCLLHFWHAPRSIKTHEQAFVQLASLANGFLRTAKKAAAIRQSVLRGECYRKERNQDVDRVMVGSYPAQQIIDLGESSGPEQFINLIEDDVDCRVRLGDLRAL